MQSDVTSEASVTPNNNESILSTENAVKVVKKVNLTSTQPTRQVSNHDNFLVKLQLSLFVFIYCVGYFGLSMLWACGILIILVWDSQRRKDKKQRLDVARAVALGHENDIILNAVAQLPQWVKFSEVERVEWLNRMFKQIWQQVNEYTQDLVPKILEPSIQGYVSDFKFTRVVLGNVVSKY